MKPAARLARLVALVALAASVPLTAGAAVRKEGAWPASEKPVTFAFDGKPSEGLQKLAHEAGWSLVVSKGITLGEHDVHIDVKEQPADAVLDALFTESSVVARRSGSLVSVVKDEQPAPAAAPADPAAPEPAAADAPAPPPAPAAPPVPTVRGEDRDVVGGSLTIREGEVVHTVTVTGGSVKVYGTVTGDLVVAGGSAKIESGGRVVGNATVFGGSLKVEDGGRVDGDVGVVGGSLKREDGAIIGGNVVDGAGSGRVKVTKDDDGVRTEVEPSRQPGRTGVAAAVHELGQRISKMALLFVFGCVVLALGTRRMEVLRAEVAARPMRAFAMGIVGAIASVLTVVVLCVTVVGIPVAVIGVLLGVLAFYASLAAVLTTFGAAVIGHKTKNPYLHLLLGCGALLVVGSIPYVGGVVTFVLGMLSLGILFTTRLAGALDRRPRSELV